MAYERLVNLNLQTQDYAGMCLRYAQSFVGAPVRHPSAWEAWLATTIKHTDAIPQEAGVPSILWFSHYGTYQGIYANWGHVAIHVPGDAIYTSPGFGYGYERWANIAQIEERFNCKYVGWSEDLNGLRVCKPIEVKPQPWQRVTGSNPVTRRADATTQSARLEPSLNPNTVADFDGWKRGEFVDDGINATNIWVRGKYSGNWFWLGGFTSLSTDGLADLNPVAPALKPNERRAGALPANVRIASNTSAKVVATVPAGGLGEFTHWQEGEVVNGKNLWYRNSVGNVSWSGGYTEVKKDGLTEYKAPTPAPEPENSKWNYVAPEIKNFDATNVPSWVNFETVLDKEISGFIAEKWNTDLAVYYDGKYQFGGKNYNPEECHLHWWDLPEKKPTHDGVVNYLKSTPGVTVNFVVSAGRITSMIPLEFMATTTGARNLWGWKVEVDPSLTDEVYATLAWLIYEVEKQNTRLMSEPLRLHKEFMATSCSEIDIARVRREVDALHAGAVKPEPTPSTEFELVKVPLRVVENKDGSFDAYVEILQPKK